MTVVDGDELMSVGEIGSEPGEGGASDAKGGLETGEENGVIDRVKGSTEAISSSSRRMRIFREPVSEDSRRSLVTLRRAVSVLCLERKPDWKSSKRSLVSR